MRFLLLLLTLVLQLNISGYANHNPQENHAQKTLIAENTFSDGHSYELFRYYSPDEGMNISQDPIGLVGGFELYGYVKDVNSWVDVFGLDPMNPVYIPSGAVFSLDNRRLYAAQQANLSEIKTRWATADDLADINLKERSSTKNAGTSIRVSCG